MTPAAFHRAILRSAALLVPESQRPDWLAEWRSELWHVRRDPRGRNVAAFCMGAFRDAFWLRRHSPIQWSSGALHLNLPGPPAGIESFPDEGVPALSSPVRCLSWLAALGALCIVAAFLLPAARMVLRCSLYPRDLVMLSPVEAGDPSVQNGFLDPYPSVSLKQFESLKAHSAGQFAGLAFYVPARLPVETPNGKRTLSVARTTADLVRLLNIPIESLNHGAEHAYSGKPVLVPASAASQWNLPASVDGWLIEDEAVFANLPEQTEGFVIGRLRYDDLHNSQFHFIRLRERSLVMFWIVLVAFALGCIFLVIIPSDSSGGHLRRIGPRRGLFLAAKTLLVLPIVIFGSLDLASLGGSLSLLYFDLALFGSLFAVRWINADQRKRCPVCLRLLANPVRIGEPSRILLEWHGTELMCLRGHGLLYVPEWPAIWSGRQRWMGLGTSWGGLFPLAAGTRTGNAATRSSFGIPRTRP
jgi:hypothetical protein